MTKGIPANVRQIVERRSRGICEGCNAAAATEMHHRLFRSRGGGHEVANLIHLCGWGNHTGCHGIAHSGKQGEANGWALPSSVDPSDAPENRPIWDGLGWWRLGQDGSKTPCKENNR